MSAPKHSWQPMIRDARGVIRFKANPIVKYLLANGGIDLTEIAMRAMTEHWSKDDQAHFAQLIGYSVSGWGDLSYVSRKNAGKADAMADKLLHADDVEVKAEEINQRLAGVYTTEGLAVWWSSRNRNFGGSTPRELLDAREYVMLDLEVDRVCGGGMGA